MRAMVKNPNDPKWKRAIEAAFPDTAPPNIIMTADTEREEKEAAQKRAEASRYRRDGLPKELAEQLYNGKIPPMPGDELPMDDWMRLREGRPTRAEEQQRAEKMKNEQAQAEQMAKFIEMQQSVYGVTSFPDSIFSDPPKQTKPRTPKKPEKTTEQAQEELTGLGRRKIILDGENKS